MKWTKPAPLAFLMASLAGGAQALPINPQTVATSGGTPAFNTGAGTLTVDTNAERLVIEWDAFFIGPSESVTFNQPGGTSIVVNRVPLCALCSAQPLSVIDGALASNGNVWILDSRGVFFGANAQVDVHGLLASSANLLGDSAFVSAALGDPVVFDGSTAQGGVVVDEGAQITVRGGPAIFVADSIGGLPGVEVAGSVTGLSPSSQVLLGAAYSFSLRFGATPPDAMSNSDLQLFDFIIETTPPRVGPSVPPTDPIDLILTGSTAQISAGTVYLAGAAPPPDPFFPPVPAQFHIGGRLESTAGPLVINGAGGLLGGAASGTAANADIDILFEREVIGFLDQMGQPQSFLAPQTQINAAAGLNVIGRSIHAPQTTQLGPDFQSRAVPDHLTLQISSGGPATLQSGAEISLRNVSLLTPVNLSAGTVVDVGNSLGGNVLIGQVSAPAGIFIAETPTPSGAPAAQPVSFTTGDLTSSAGPVTVTASGQASVGIVNAGQAVQVEGALGVNTGAITSGEAISIAALQGSIGTGALTAVTSIGVRAGVGSAVTGALVAPGMRVDALQGDVVVGGAQGQTLLMNANGDVTLAGATLSAAATTPVEPVLHVIAGGDVSFTGAVTSVRDVFVQAGGIFSTSAPLRVTGASASGLTVGMLPVFGGVDIRADDVVLGDLVEVQGAAGAGVNLLATSSAAVGNGVSAPFSLSSAEVQRVVAPLLAVRVLPTAGTGTLTLGTLTLDGARIGETILAAGGAVRVPGTVSGANAPGVRLGDGVLVPARIEIAGAFGTLAAPLGRTRVDATGDILIGTQAFVDLFNQASDPASFDPGALAANLGGATSGQLFLVAGVSTFSAPGAILSQNTGGTSGDGMRFTLPATGGAFGAPAFTARVDVFAQVTARTGAAVSGLGVAVLAGLLNDGVTPSQRLSINNCTFGASCATTSTSIDPVSIIGVSQQRLGPPPQTKAPDTGGGSQGGQQGASSARRAGNASNNAIEVEDATLVDAEAPEDGREVRDPGVGSANEDLWPSVR
jgi:filamentous hemagglutinin family protein